MQQGSIVSRVAALLALASLATLTQAAEAVFSEPAPATLLNSVQYDLTSAITGRDYRIFISAPIDAGPDKAYPVLYIFDGNRDFGRVAQSGRGIMVGIGYPVQDMRDVGTRRVLDLTPTADASRPNGAASGDADRFLQVLEEEIRPFVESRYNLVADNQSLYGHSFGGLAVLRHMFRKPESFNAFLIGSPSIWWDNTVVLEDEAAFAERVRAGELNLRVLVTSAGDEQDCGPELGATEQADCQQSRMVDNAGELAARLGALNPAKLQVTRVIFEGESHGSSVPATLARALNFAMP